MDRRTIDQPVIDGFCYNLSQLFVPGRYEPMALGQLEALRKSGLFRARWYAVPEEPMILAAYETFEQQVRIVPGSYLWGIISSLLPGAIFPPAVSLLVRIVEGSTGIPLMSDFVDGGNMGIPVPISFSNHPVLLTQPRLIVDPGWMSVEFTNPNAVPITADMLQIVLLCAEPCVVIEEGLQLSECAQ